MKEKKKSNDNIRHLSHTAKKMFCTFCDGNLNYCIDIYLRATRSRSFYCAKIDGKNFDLKKKIKLIISRRIYGVVALSFILIYCRSLILAILSLYSRGQDECGDAFSEFQRGGKFLLFPPIKNVVLQNKKYVLLKNLRTSVKVTRKNKLKT